MAEWVILELGPMAEGEDPTLITASIRHVVGKDAEVFIPAVTTQVGDDRVITYLVDGYAFIRRARPDSAYFRLDETRYVRTVVRDFTGNGRSPACITDRDIEKFRRQIRIHSDQGIDIGDTVQVINGPYKNLQAVVIEDIPEQASVQVRIELRSKDSLVLLPRSFLRLVTKASIPPYLLRVREHRSWFNEAKTALLWPTPDYVELLERLHLYSRLNDWLHKGRFLQASIRLENAPQALTGMRELLGQYHSLSRWMRVGSRLHSFVKAFSLNLTPQPLLTTLDATESLRTWYSKHQSLHQHLEVVEKPLAPERLDVVKSKFDWIQSKFVEVLDIARTVNLIERSLEERPLVENIVIDGMNMVVRCSMAPGLGSLHDSRGRPTGAIVGFLNSLAALRKRFPEAAIWVCWDHPSNRRRQLFSAYKSNRNPLRHTFEVAFLKAALPVFGVWQAGVEGEEADDVVASLVRGRLEGQHNLIVSNDRDFMQLVTETTHVLVPAVGAGKERLCTPAIVQEEYGVPADKMVHLRAIGGDTSDNIPGAPGCGNKTASKLLQLYGTVEGIYSSSLAGLSPALCEKLRGAEKQVRLNLTLMALVTDLPVVLVPPLPDAKVATQYLDDIEMKPTRVMPAFFPEAVEVAA